MFCQSLLHESYIMFLVDVSAWLWERQGIYIYIIDRVDNIEVSEGYHWITRSNQHNHVGLVLILQEYEAWQRQ